MSKYKISVIISTYNTGDYLNEFLDSIKSQSIGFDNVEVIFVDDNSSDEKTLALLRKLDESYDNVRAVFSNKNSGFPGTGRNIGLDLANSDYVIFADHDDTYTPEAFEVMCDKIADNDMLISNFNQVYSDRTVPFKSIYGNKGEIQVSDISQDENLLRVPAAIWTRLFRKNFLTDNSIRFLEGMLAEDVYVASYACLKANGIIYLNDFYSYNYKIRDSEDDKSTIHVRNRKYIEAMLNGYYKIDEMLVNLNQVSYGKTIFKSHLTSWLYTIVLSELSDADREELFIRSYDIFSKYYSKDPYFRNRYDKLVELILNKNFKDAVLESKRLKRVQENMNDAGIFSKIKNKLGR